MRPVSASVVAGALASIVLVVGCGGGSARPADPTHTAAPKAACERMADHLVSVLRSGGAGGSAAPADEPTEAIDKISKIIVDRCVTDAWSADATACFQAVPSLEAADQCAPKLTVSQRDAADKAMAEAFGGTAPAPGGPAPAPGSAD